MSRDEHVIHSVPTMTHGRVLVAEARAAAARGLLVGFHGYGESAATHMERLRAIPGAASWTLVSVQALHRFYDRKTGQVIACWMTHEDREDAIADNVGYITAALESVPHNATGPIVFAGFSQGAAMAYRAACRGPRTAAGIISVGGDVPPELLQDPDVDFPRVLMIRGRADEWYAQQKFADDTTALRARGVELESLLVEGGHEWHQPVIDAAARFLNGVADPPRSAPQRVP
jgi:predicted esterase